MSTLNHTNEIRFANEAECIAFYNKFTNPNYVCKKPLSMNLIYEINAYIKHLSEEKYSDYYKRFMRDNLKYNMVNNAAI